jgi:hypothetical protein
MTHATSVSPVGVRCVQDRDPCLASGQDGLTRGSALGVQPHTPEADAQIGGVKPAHGAIEAVRLLDDQ